MAGRSRTVPGVSDRLRAEELNLIVKLALILRSLHWSHDRFTALVVDFPE